MHNIHALSHCVSSNMFCSSQHWSIFLHCRIALAGMKMGTLLWEQLYLDLSWFCGRQPVSFGQPRSSGVVMTRQGSSFWGKKKEKKWCRTKIWQNLLCRMAHWRTWLCEQPSRRPAVCWDRSFCHRCNSTKVALDYWLWHNIIKP